MNQNFIAKILLNGQSTTSAIAALVVDTLVDRILL